MNIQQFSWILFTFLLRGAPKAHPAIRVARLNGVRCVATLANGRGIGCALRLASIRSATQRSSR
jgi:hypothetical protein